MSEKGTKKSKKHQKSEVSADVQEPVSEAKAKSEPENGQDIAPEMSSKEDVPKKRKRTKGDNMLNESATSRADVTQPKTKKTKKQKRTEGDEGLEESAAPAADAITQPKPKKSTKRTEGDETLGDEATTPAADAGAEPKPKKSKKRKQVEGNETQEEPAPPAADTMQPKPKKSKKRKQTEGDEMPGVPTTGAATQPKPKKSRKQKQTEGDEALDESNNPGADADTESKPKKTKKQKDDAKPHLSQYPDPRNDESLAEQSNKALTYAYERFQAFETWKFNKGRQNWLLRNFWSDKAIPDNYLPFVIKYFADLKGSSREKLIETCNSKISAAGQTADDDGKPAGGSAIPQQPNSSRAQSLLQSLTSEST